MSAPSDAGRFDRPQIRDMVFRLAEWGANSEGSSRSSALIRITLAAIFWARLANDMTFTGIKAPSACCCR